MYFPDETIAYLRGKKYVNALPVQFIFDQEDAVYRSQIDLLCELVEGKKVIHLGCLDHNIETVRHKMKRKKWLHGRLMQKAARCHGVDIEEEGIRFLQEKLKLKDTSCSDIFSEEFQELAASDDWDYLLIPEVLEHLEAPTRFLRAIARRHGSRFDKLILTVPNAISQDNWQLARRGCEMINSDHRFWFTPYTIAKTILGAGLDVEKILMCRHGTINWRAFLRNRFYRRHPLLRNDILCIATMS